VSTTDESSTEAEMESFSLTTESITMQTDKADELEFYSSVGFTEEPAVTGAPSDELDDELKQTKLIDNLNNITENPGEFNETTTDDSLSASSKDLIVDSYSEEIVNPSESTEESMIVSYSGSTGEAVTNFPFETTGNPLEFTKIMHSPHTDEPTEDFVLTSSSTHNDESTEKLIASSAFLSVDESYEKLVINSSFPSAEELIEKSTTTSSFLSTGGSSVDSFSTIPKENAGAYSTVAPLVFAEEHVTSDSNQLPSLSTTADLSPESVPVDLAENVSVPVVTITNVKCNGQTGEVILQVNTPVWNISSGNSTFNQLRMRIQLSDELFPR